MSVLWTVLIAMGLIGIWLASVGTAYALGQRDAFREVKRWREESEAANG